MTTLLLIDLQKGMCDPAGSGGATGLADVVSANKTLPAAARALTHARTVGMGIVHVRLAFDSAYSNRTNATQRFAAHESAGRFAAGSFDTEWCDEVAPREGEATVQKGSVSPFASTSLLTLFARRRETHLVIAGVATHLAVESAAREGADRGLQVDVLGDACAAPQALHEHSLHHILPGFATVTTVDDFRRNQ